MDDMIINVENHNELTKNSVCYLMIIARLQNMGLIYKIQLLSYTQAINN